MFPVRYIHAADLHLDAAFSGISREASGADMAARLRTATFTALERLFSLCEREKPDFLVIAGDIYNQEDHSVKAQMALRDGCERLAACGVRIFLAHGNHDPLSSRLQSLHWPDNTTIFGDSVESHIVTRDAVPVAVVHGISHATAREMRNLAQSFSRLDMEGHTQNAEARRCFQLGVLHCTLEGTSHADRYAPCTPHDLQTTGLDAWALGHVHERRIVNEQPFVAYPGNTQGLHINESGPRGCLLVSATPDAAPDAELPAFSCTASFHPLGPVQWETLTVSAEGVTDLNRLETAIADSMEKAGAATDVSCSTLMVRVRLAGRTELDAILRAPGAAADLAERLRGESTGRPLVWLKDLMVDTGQWLDMEALLRREDLLGETLRLAKERQSSSESLTSLASDALHPLARHAKTCSALTPPEAEELSSLLDDAQRLCIDLMEAR